ncbi:uncharacterized protein LOC130767647 isoform X2 [Actinidia eriantha]|uniref:uncharacterized protein LOC130767647 isoform X2 n=1 Tax=Actinidia eriantha TaxID=165200 RepID=UPI00258AD01A|nr:uncharacterized protein LOC130767647 isoform X2 [Actinidia eriantha]
MDSPETTEKEKEKSHRHRSSCLRRSLAFLVYLTVFLSISFLLGVVVVFVGSSSISNPISVPAHCKIVSSNVDLRSSKVCELGLLNYKAKYVFYPFEGKKFRCRHDYYWASVFEVEYEDHSGETRLALAEAPNEALPIDCRPNFRVAWLTKDRFKVPKDIRILVCQKGKSLVQEVGSNSWCHNWFFNFLDLHNLD